MRVLSLAIVGAEHPNKDGGNRRSEILFCDPGEPVDLRPEPKNKFDPRAIAVFSARNFQIGYVRAEQAQWIGTLLRDGRITAAVFQQAMPNMAWIRLGIDGAEPDLPPPFVPPPAEDDSGWYPDEVWPDD